MPSLVADRYRLGTLLGSGGMGQVWRAHDEILGRDVAVKQLMAPPGLDEPEAVHRRMLREARAAARLSHPGVVQIFDVLEVDGGTWIVMEYVPSVSLQEALAADGPFDVRRTAHLGLDLLATLVAADRAGVEHRDVKPANILLADDGRVLLTDFGIATITGDELATSSDALIGSPDYMSPERAQHGHDGLASDLWSLGATLYAAVEGRAPFHRPTVGGTLTALATEPPDPPQRAGALQPLLEALLRKDPKARPTPSEAADSLQALTLEPETVRADARPAPHSSLAEPAGSSLHEPAVGSLDEPAVGSFNEPAGGSVDQPAERSLGRPKSARRWLLAGVLAVLLLAVGAGIWVVNRPSGRTVAQPPAATSAATRDPSPAPPSGTSSASSSATSATPGNASPATSSSATTSSSRRPPLPAGWRDYHDPTGFSLYVPTGWTRSKKGSIVYFRSKGRVLGIDQSKHPKSDPVADWREQSAYRVSHGDFPGYHRIRIAPVAYWQKAADWEFTFTDSGVRQHVNNRGLVVSKSQAYGIYWQTRDSSWPSLRPDLDLVFASFRPA